MKSIKSLVLFPLCPFVAFLQSTSNLRNVFNQIVFVLFFGLFGYCHTFTDVRADSYRKFEYFNNYQTYSSSDIAEELVSGQIKDVYEELLFGWIKGFSNDPHIMMMFVGLIGGFFYMLVVKRFLQDKWMNFTWPIIILLSFMIFESNIPLMGGIRNFTAFPIFVYSLIKILLDGKNYWYIGLFATPLIHFGYTPLVLIVILISIIKLPTKVLHYACIIACVSSIFLSTSSYAGVLDIGLDLIGNESISSRIAHYGDAATEEHFAGSLTTRLIGINNKISACFIAIFLLFVRRRFSNLIKTSYDERLYNILLVFIAISFAMISFSVVGQRYVYVAMVLLYMFMLRIYQNNVSLVSKYIYALPIVYILHIAWFFYNCYCNTGLDIYYQPLPLLLL